MQELQSIQSGQRVIVRDEPWLVVESERFDGVAIVTLRGVGAENLGDAASVLMPFDEVRRPRHRTRVVRRGRRDVLQAAAAAIAGAQEWGDCWTAAQARIDLRAWQLAPARAILNGACRVLLADEVGLGKTIQALLIVSELRVRGLARRTLVLTPASIRDQWAHEASARFGLTATVFDQVSLAAATAALPAGVNPWITEPFVIASIDLVKRPEVRAALDEVTPDVLIVDEAHHLTPGSDRAAVVTDLALRAPWVVLVTATPHSGDEAAFRFLRALGAASDRERAIVTFRRQARELRGTALRRVHQVTVGTTAEERALLDETLAYAKAVWSGPGGSGTKLVASVIARRAASSAGAALRTLERRLALIGGSAVPEPQPRLPWEDESDDGGLDDDVLATPGLTARDDETAWLQTLVALARTASTRSSKLEVIRRVLRRTREHVLVFSGYRDVVCEIAGALRDLTTVGVLHGGLSPAERRHQVAAFNDGRLRTLVATDAAGEGLNLHARCRLVVNLELPWSPLRLEQRIGRVDRIGQTRRVHAIHLVHSESFEDTVRARFDERQARAADQTSAIDYVSEPALESTTSIETVDVAAERARRLRSLGGSTSHDGRDDALVAFTPSATCADPRALVLLYTVASIDGRKQIVQQDAIAVRLEWPAIARHNVTAALVRRLAWREDVRAIVDAQTATRALVARTAIERAAAAWEQRGAALIAVAAGRRPRPIQTSLFDRREEQRCHARQTALSRWQAHLERHVEAARSLRRIDASTPQLVAAWIAG